MPGIQNIKAIISLYTIFSLFINAFLFIIIKVLHSFYLKLIFFPVPEYELINVRIIKKRSVDENKWDDNNAAQPKQIHVTAFGKQLNLNLKENSDFNDRIQDMKVFMAETTSNGKLRYSEAPATNSVVIIIISLYHYMPLFNYYFFCCLLITMTLTI